MKIKYRIFPFTLLLLLSISCKKFVEIGPPKTSLVRETVFSSDASATAAIIEVYAKLANGFANGSLSSVTLLGALSADELSFYAITNLPQKEIFDNQLQPVNTEVGVCWSSPWEIIYRANAILEGIKDNDKITLALKNRMEGEAKFVRAFCHFYLVNLFGDVPLITTTDYRINRTVLRKSKTDIYQQIILDLKDAQNLLSDNYLDKDNKVTQQRARVNKVAVTAFLARVYLYLQDWQNAEIQSSLVISNIALYNLAKLEDVFLKNSKEAIWQLSNDFSNSNDAATFILPVSIVQPATFTLRSEFVSSFEDKDQRKITWVGNRVSGSNTFYFPHKYKIVGFSNPVIEYSMVIRLGELYLIRAEARINQTGKIIDGVNDLNIVRNRASLPPPNNLPSLSLNLNKEQAMLALETERNHELFTEWSHRWLDLKRWPSQLSPNDNTLNRADDILKVIKSGWRKEAKLFPIPKLQLDNDPAMAGQQNPGY